MNEFIDKVRPYFEIPFFGVCTKIGEKLNIPARYIRLNFIYVSLLTFGSPILVYLILAFWINIKHYINKRRNTIWDL